MAAQATLTHMFAELYMLEDLGVPLKGSSRIRYTCMSVSRRYIALGCNTGGVYVFGRDSLKHLQSIYGDVDSCPVSVVALSPNELNVGFAVSSGQVVVMEMNIERRSKPERLRQTSDHLGAMVTAMVWDSSSSSLFVGDCSGKVTHINVPTSKAKTIFSQPSQTIVQLDCGVTQLDWWGNKLLASSLTRTYLLNTAKQQFSQIGKKPREGEFGACFFLEPSSNYPVIYCARPGSRMWEVDFEGNVLNTHQFKQLLATQPLPIISPGVNLIETLKASEPGPQSVNFLQMFAIGEFILTWSNRGLYVFDPINVKVVLWTDTLKGIKDVCIIKNEVYIFCNSQKVRRLVFLPILHLCAALVTRQRCLMAADMLLFLEHVSVKPTLLKHVKKELLPQLLGLLREAGRDDVGVKVQAMLEDVSESSMESVIFQEDGGSTEGALSPLFAAHSSGIVVVSDGILAYGDPERRKSPNRFSPVIGVGQPHGESSGRSSPQSGSESREQTGSGPEHSSTTAEWQMKAGERPHAASGTTEDTVCRDRNVSGPEAMRESREYTQLTTEEAAEDDGGYSVAAADPVTDSAVRAGDGESPDRPLPTFSEQTSEGDFSTGKAVCPPFGDSQTVREEGDSQVHQTSDSDAPDPFESQSREGVLPVDGEEDVKEEDGTTAMDQGSGGSRLMRKVSSMPEIIVEKGETSKDSVRSAGSISRGESVLIPIRRASSDSAQESIAKPVKKKKRRRANEVNIPLTGTSSGHMNSAQSLEMLKKKKNKEMVHPATCATPSSNHIQEHLSQATDTEADAISIATVSSIEEENNIFVDETPVTPRPELGNDFPAPKEAPSAMDMSGMDQAFESIALEEERGGGAVSAANDAAFSDSDSEVSPFQHLLTTQMNGHSEIPGDADLNDSDFVESELFDGANDCDESRVPVVGYDEEAMTDASRSLSSEKLTFSGVSSESEVIPPLIERLSALGLGAPPLRSEEGTGNVHDLSVVKSLLTEASKQKIASVKERVTKFGSTTKSLIRRVKEKNRLVSRSPSGSPPFRTGSSSTSPPREDTRRLNTLDTDDDAVTSVDLDMPPPCPIHLDCLLAQTAATHFQLKDYSVLLDQRHLRQVLNTWAVELNHTLVAYHTELHRRQAQRHRGAATSDSEHGDFPSKEGKEELQNGVNMTAEGRLNSEVMDEKNVTLSAGSDTGDKQTDGQCEMISHPEVGKIAVHAESQVQTQENSDSEGLVSADDSPGQSVATNSSSVHSDPPTRSQTDVTASSIEKGTLTADSEETSAEQNVTDQFDRKRPSSHGGDADEMLEHQVSVEEPRETEVRPVGDALSQVEVPIDWSQVCHVIDPFKLPPQQHMAVSMLASYCLECGCFGNAAMIFGQCSPEPQTVSSKEHKSETVPFSSTSFIARESGLPSLGGQCLAQGTSWERVPTHSPQPSAQTDDSQPSCDPHKCSPALPSEQNSAVKAANQNSDTAFQVLAKHSPAPAAQGFDLREDRQSTEFCQVSKGLHGSDDGCVTGVSDEERALFVRLHYPFLPHWRLRQLLVDSDVSKVHATWCAVVTCCQALGRGDPVWRKIQDRDVTGALDYLRSGILPNKLAFLGHVASLFGHGASKVTDFLSEVPRQVKLSDVVHLCRLHSSSVQQVVARFLAQRLGATPLAGRLEILRQMCTSTETKLAVLDCLLHLRSSYIPSSASSISSEARFRASADPSNKFSPDLVDQTLDCALSLVKDGESERALAICGQFRYWPGCLRLLKQTDQWQRALLLEVKLNDINLLNGCTAYGVTPRNVEQWQYLLRLYQQASTSHQGRQEPPPHIDDPPPAPPPPTPATSLPPSASQEAFVFPSSLSVEETSGKAAVDRDLENINAVHSAGATASPGGRRSEREGADLNPAGLTDGEHTTVDGAEGQRLSWLSLGLLAAHHLGAHRAGQLLQSCVEGDGDDAAAAGGILSADFFRTYLTLSALHNQQRLVIHNMLEKVDSYLWAKKPVHLTPQVHYAVTQEKLAVQGINREDLGYHNLFARLSSSSVAETQLAEDPDCHWGMAANILGRCEVCSIEVNETVSHVEPGIYIFQCGHVFHKFCVPDKECPIC